MNLYKNVLVNNYSMCKHKRSCLKKALFPSSTYMRKPAFCICENKDADQLRVNAKLISAFVFATRIVQTLYFLYPKFQASSYLLWLYSPVCGGPGRKPRRLVFSQLGSYSIHLSNVNCYLKPEAINAWNGCKIKTF